MSEEGNWQTEHEVTPYDEALGEESIGIADKRESQHQP